MLDTRLAKTLLVASKELTIGDISLGNAIHRGFKFQIPQPELPNLKAWYERLRARPAYQTHIASL